MNVFTDDEVQALKKVALATTSRRGSDRTYTQEEMDENYRSGKTYYVRQIRQILDSLRTDAEKLAAFAKWAEDEAEIEVKA